MTNPCGEYLAMTAPQLSDTAAQAGLGTLAYTPECVLTKMGTERRSIVRSSIAVRVPCTLLTRAGASPPTR
jgi:hypothetical protein